ncbi:MULTISPECIES: carbohydrate ABC transporter permease [Oceanobacillus]|uniref:carbohydrate ABC transporter permease n=1 Tax=Oceanobacillus TaxID=182709 RepID=UPI0021162DAD|nr:carbohydrate ABC transporter permease [Oceanobacillus oncorhynchi]UUI39895.1 carbohydrate ABC transporter permease [Oceanobacillus oncorhynchi]
MNTIKRKKTIYSVLELIGVLLVVIFLFFPILWILLTAFKSGEDVYSISIIFEPTLDNFRRLFSSAYNFENYYMNSLIVVFFTLIITVPVSILAAYSISRYRIPGKTLLMFAILATQFIPLIVNVIPFFSAFRNWGLLDTTVALIIVNLGHTIPYAIWLIKGFMDSIPKDMEEAGAIDGASRLRIIWNIVLPMAKPGIITATVFCFVVVWNEFMFALILTSQEAVTLPVALSYFVGENGVIWNEMAAAGVIYVIPTIIFMLIVRKQFVKGMSAGAIK